MLEGVFHAQDLEAYDTYRLTTCIHSNWQLKALQNARLNAPLDIYVKVNSGMNRLGFQPEAGADRLAAIAGNAQCR